jgi:hypothetical protein
VAVIHGEDPISETERRLAELHTALGYKRLNRTWAKIEILLGLFAVGTGLFLGDWSLSRSGSDIEWGLSVAGVALFTFGGYLALAGHRSHLYQSGNERTAYLAELIRSMNDKGKRE